MVSKIIRIDAGPQTFNLLENGEITHTFVNPGYSWDAEIEFSDTEPEPEPTTDAIWANELYLTSGINFHPNFTGFHDLDRVNQLVGDLGVHLWRGMVGTQADPHAEAQWLWDNYGMKGVVLVARFTDGPNGPVFNHTEVLNFIRALKGKTWVYAISGPNESLKNYEGREATAVQSVLAVQKLIYDTVKAELPGVLVLGPSTYRRLSPAFDALAGTGNCDMGELHAYNSADIPTLAEMDLGKIVPLDTLVDYARKIKPDAPCFITESNWSTADTSPTAFHLPPEVAASYNLRMHLISLLHPGIAGYITYAITDQDLAPNSFWGLCDVVSSTEVRPREGYWALQRMMELVNVGDREVPERGLNYLLSGRTEDTREVLLQTPTGHILILWREVPEWDKQRLVKINQTPVEMRLFLPSMRRITPLRPVGGRVGTTREDMEATIPVHADPTFILLEDL